MLINIISIACHSAVSDPCESSATNNCSQLCTSFPGGFQCSCIGGYELDDDGVTCAGIIILNAYIILLCTLSRMFSMFVMYSFIMEPENSNMMQETVKEYFMIMYWGLLERFFVYEQNVQLLNLPRKH